MKKYVFLVSLVLSICSHVWAFASVETCTNSVLDSVSFEIIASSGSTNPPNDITPVSQVSGGGGRSEYIKRMAERGIETMSNTFEAVKESISFWETPSHTESNENSGNKVQILPTQSYVKFEENTEEGYKIYTLGNRITDYICPQIVQVYEDTEVNIWDFQTEGASDSVKSTVMFRGIEKNGLDGPSAFYFNKKSWVTMNDGLFEPERDVTRAEYIKMIIRSLSCRYEFMWTESGFPDVDSNFWYSEYITYAVKNGWIHGYEDGNFYPNKSITRAEAAKILANAIRLSSPEKDASSFTDVSADNIFLKYIESLRETNVMRGINNETFLPETPISRTDAAKMIYRTFFGGN